MREGLLSRIGFLSAFLSGAEIRFFRSLFSNDGNRENRASFTRPHAYGEVAEFLGTSFLGLWSVPGRYVPILSLCEGFSSQEATDVSDPSWVCPQESRLSREGRTDPATCTGTLVTR